MSELFESKYVMWSASIDMNIFQIMMIFTKINFKTSFMHTAISHFFQTKFVRKYIDFEKSTVDYIIDAF